MPPRLALICAVAMAAAATAWAEPHQPPDHGERTATPEPPRVVEVIPGRGDLIDADAVTEFLVRFDRDMSPRGHSACGLQQDWLPDGAAPRWEDPRTWVLPVRLHPGRTYSWSVNCPSFRGFRSADGAEAEPYPVTFRTLARGEPLPEPATPQTNRAAIDALRRAIADRYSHRDRLGLDWDALFAAYAERLEAAPTSSAFARLAADMLAAAEDIHLWLDVNGIPLGAHRSAVAPNINVSLLEKTVPGFTWPNRRVATGRFENGVGYLLIASWEDDAGGRAEADLEAAHAAIDRFINDHAPGLIIDVRLNSGGSEPLARSIASRFVAGRTVYARSLIRDPDDPLGHGWRGPFDRAVDPDPNRRPFTAPVAVLIGPACMSSNESFIQMLHASAADDRPRALVGARTRGSSGNPRPHDLGNGVRVHLPSWQDLQLDGTPIEGVGISPDIEAPWPDPDPAHDPVIDAALRWLAEAR